MGRKRSSDWVEGEASPPELGTVTVIGPSITIRGKTYGPRDSRRIRKFAEKYEIREATSARIMEDYDLLRGD